MEIRVADKSFTTLQEIGKVFPHASSAALNKLARRARSRISKEIRKDYHIKKKDLDQRMEIKRSTAKTLTATLKVTGKRIPLIAFKVKKQSRRSPLSVIVKKGTRIILPKAFMAKMKFSTGVFMRKGSNRRDVRYLYGPDISDLVMSKHSQKLVDRLVNDDFPKLLQHEIEYRLSRANTTSASGATFGESGERLDGGDEA